MSERVFLSLGSNMGEREANLREALSSLLALSEVNLVSVSSFYSSPPWGVTDQRDFLNCAVELWTTLEPLGLLTALNEIESEMGRVPSRRWGERLIDLDIVFYGKRLISEPGLTIPQNYALERDFVLIPISEIAPDFIFPGLGKTIGDLASVISGSSVKRLSEFAPGEGPLLKQMVRK